MRGLLAWVAVLTGCAAQHVAGAELEPTAEGDCVFGALLDGYEAAGGFVPDECANLAEEYKIKTVSYSENFGCNNEPLGPDHVQIGCALPEDRTLYLREADERAMVSAAVHVWMHVLADCVLGDYDRRHLRAGLWVNSGGLSAETRANANAVASGCKVVLGAE